VTDYRVYFIGTNARVEQARELDAADDKEAIRAAAQLFDGRPMELWQRGRIVRKFGIMGESPTSPA
jgi:hypothetical protein